MPKRLKASLKRFAFECLSGWVQFICVWDNLRNADFAALQFLDLSGHALEERCNFISRTFTQVNRQRFSRTIRQTQIIFFHTCDLFMFDAFRLVAFLTLLDGDAFCQVTWFVYVAAT